MTAFRQRVFDSRRSDVGHERRVDPLPITSGLPRTTDINRPGPGGGRLP